MDIDGFIVDIDPFRVIGLSMINWIAGWESGWFVFIPGVSPFGSSDVGY